MCVFVDQMQSILCCCCFCFELQKLRDAKKLFNLLMELSKQNNTKWTTQTHKREKKSKVLIKNTKNGKKHTKDALENGCCKAQPLSNDKLQEMKAHKK